MPDQSSEKDLRLAVLIDADNASRTAMKDVMAEVAVYGHPHHQAHLRRLDQSQHVHLEVYPAGDRHYPHPAVQLYHRKELHRFGL